MGLMEGLDYMPISPGNPHRFILKGWGVELRVLGFNPQIKAGN